MNYCHTFFCLLAWSVCLSFWIFLEYSKSNATAICLRRLKDKPEHYPSHAPKMKSPLSFTVRALKKVRKAFWTVVHRASRRWPGQRPQAAASLEQIECTWEHNVSCTQEATKLWEISHQNDFKFHLSVRAVGCPSFQTQVHVRLRFHWVPLLGRGVGLISAKDIKDFAEVGSGELEIFSLGEMIYYNHSRSIGSDRLVGCFLECLN